MTKVEVVRNDATRNNPIIQFQKHVACSAHLMDIKAADVGQDQQNEASDLVSSFTSAQAHSWRLQELW